METGNELILNERKRQIEKEGWSIDHDDFHLSGCLAQAALCYEEGTTEPSHGYWWPFDIEWWKPSDDIIKNLVKAGALNLAEIERLQRRNVEISKQIDIELSKKHP